MKTLEKWALMLLCMASAIITATLVVLNLSRDRTTNPQRRATRSINHILSIEASSIPIFFPVLEKSQDKPLHALTTPLSIEAEAPFEVLHAIHSGSKPPTDSMCLINGSRHLIQTPNMISLAAPYQNLSWAAVFDEEQGVVVHTSERFCQVHLQTVYKTSINNVELAATLRSVPPHRRNTHRCARVRHWIGADCAVGTLTRAVLSDCITQESLLNNRVRNAQCTFEHLCCHEIKEKGRAFLFLNSTTNLTLVDTQLRVGAKRYLPNLGLHSYAFVRALDGAAYLNDTTGTPILKNAALLPKINTPQPLFVILEETPGLDARSMCTLNSIRKETTETLFTNIRLLCA